VLAVTEQYMAKISRAAAEDTCAKEFGATRIKKLPSQILPVIMEATVSNALQWTGPLATCDMLTGLDFTSDDKGDIVTARVRAVVDNVNSQQKMQEQRENESSSAFCFSCLLFTPHRSGPDVIDFSSLLQKPQYHCHHRSWTRQR
jgi:hypothetical protein